MKKHVEQTPDSDAVEQPSADADSLQNVPTEDDEQEATIPAVAAKSAVHHNRRLILIGLSVVLLAAVATGAWFWYGHHRKDKAVNAVSDVSKAASVKKPAAPQYTFYQTPKQLGNLSLFSNLSVFGTNCDGIVPATNCPPEVTAGDISYYQIGTTPTNEPIIEIFYRYTNQPGAIDYMALGEPGNEYTLLAAEDGDTASNTQFITQLKASVSSNVTVDTTTTISALTFPTQTTIDGMTIATNTQDGPPGDFINGLSDIQGWYYGSVALAALTKIGQEGNVTYYEVTTDNSDPSYAVKEIYGVVGGVYAAAYYVEEPLDSSLPTSTNTPPPSITWSTGNTAAAPSNYTYSAQGCGSPNGFVIAKNITASELIVAGQGPDNTTVYELPTSSTLFNDYYTDYGGGSWISDSSLRNLTTTQFQDVHAVIIAKNALGDYVVYVRSDMFTGGQCGKPVIYLYPQKTTNVDVSVGAHITNSDPTYGEEGWQDVLAQPNGQLKYQGKTYGSLFWEGTGDGIYPLIDSGTIVPRDEVISTIKLQLQEQGLDTNEIDGFLAYWEPKLPTTPYTRLTWLDTAQMNELAPLQITPAPNTVIRIFLDFQGLQKPFSITPQIFHAPARKGFTVVEWGGLLRNP